MTEPCALVGILEDGWSGLSDEARRTLVDADLVIGVSRTLQQIKPYLAAATVTREMNKALSQVPTWIRAALQQKQKVVLLATGDPLCHGIGSWVAEQMGPEDCRVLPALSTLQLAFARFKTGWQEVRIASCHGKDTGEWFFGAPPGHGLYPAMRAIALHTRVGLFTGPGNDPARLARALILAGYGDEVRISIACCLQAADEQLFPGLPLEEVSSRIFPQPNVVLVERQDKASVPLFGLEDSEYQQRFPEKGLITKQEVRVVSLARLRIGTEAIVWDIGAGSGSVGLEAARLAPAGHVWAIEKNRDDLLNAQANARHYRISNYTLVEGMAPAHLENWPDPDAVFIGGSGGELEILIARVLDRLKHGGRLVMNFVTLENLATAIGVLQQRQEIWEVIQLQASRSQPILDMHRMAARNPVWIITVNKEEKAP